MKGGLICSFLVVLPSIFFIVNMSQVFASHVPTKSADANEDVYIVYLSDKPPSGIDLNSYYIHVLSPVLGSEEACNDALVYSYRITNGFAAKLNPNQVKLLKKQPGVLQVVEDTNDQINNP